MYRSLDRSSVIFSKYSQPCSTCYVPCGSGVNASFSSNGLFDASIDVANDVGAIVLYFYMTSSVPDGVLATYHDQGLAPFKALSFGNGVNYTAGLSEIRTSPDHGTGFGIAGKNTANPSSFKEALFTALQIYKTRKEYKELTKSPLLVK